MPRSLFADLVGIVFGIAIVLAIALPCVTNLDTQLGLFFGAVFGTIAATWLALSELSAGRDATAVDETARARSPLASPPA